MNYLTEQEKFWAEDFGNSYIERNSDNLIISTNVSLFATALSRIEKIDSCIEFGANIGLNLRALRALYPIISLSAIEINLNAANRLKEIQDVEIINDSILNFTPPRKNLI